jgi:hypothetical protein
MQVSNSTGQNTQYRVGAGGGSVPLVARSSRTGSLGAGEKITVKLGSPYPWLVEFSINGAVVASGTVKKPPAKVALAECPVGYTVSVSPADETK